MHAQPALLDLAQSAWREWFFGEVPAVYLAAPFLPGRPDGLAAGWQAGSGDGSRVLKAGGAVTGGVVGFVVAAIVIPLLVNEAGDLTRSLARCLLRWGARRIGQQLAVSAEIDETLQPELAATATASAAVPGKLSAASCAFVRSARTCMPTAWVTTVP